MKTFLITGSIMILLIVGIKYFDVGSSDVNAQNNGSTALEESAGSIKIQENNIDLGEIPIKGGTVDAVFSFSNTGSEAITLIKGGTSCMCTEAVVKNSDGKKSARIKMAGHGSSGKVNMVVEPDETAELIATFDPMAHGPNAVGSINRTVTLETNSKINPEVRFSFFGNVIR